MADEGPTTVGSINAKLVLDIDQFTVKAEEAKAEADKLDGRKVEMKAGIDTGQALAELEALAAAEKRLESAYIDLNNIEKSSTTSKQALTRAQAELVAADNQYTRALEGRKTLNADEIAAEKALAAARGISTDAIDGERAATEAATRSAETAEQVDRKLLSAKQALEIATNRQQIAQLNLDTVNQNSNATDQQRLRAQTSLLSASQQVEKASRTLADAEQAASKAEGDAASAADKSTEAHKKNADALTTNYSAMQLIIGASPLLLGATASLAAATVGLGLGFVAMAGAGVAAVIGIKEAMDNGSQAGKVYSAGIEVLLQDWQQLTGIGAVAMLDSFTKALDDVNGAMPTLNLLVSEGAQALGDMGGRVIPAVIGGLEQAEPLIRAGSSALSEFVGWLMSGGQSSGFQQFIGYAVENLPSVTQLLEDLVTTAGHIIAAFAPLGPTVITVLDELSRALNALPLPVLASIVTFAVTVGPALNIARGAMSGFGAATGQAAAEMTVFGMSAQLAVPVIGIVLAALGGLAIAFATASGSQQQATVNAQDYASALEQDNDAIGKNVAALAAQKLANDGTIDSAARLGISSQDLIGYLDGQAQATDRVNAKLKDAKTAATDVSKAYVDGNTGMILYTDQQKQLQSDADKVTNALNANKGAIDAQIKADKDAAEATKQFGDSQGNTAAQLQFTATQFGITTKNIQDAQKAYNDTTDAAGMQLATIQAVGDKYADSAISVERLVDSQMSIQGQFSATTLKMQEENDAAGLLKQALDLLNGGSLNLMEAQTNVAKSASTAASSLAKNGDTVDQVDKKTGQFTDAALANQAALQQAAASAQQHAEAVAKATGSTEKGTQALADDKVALENSLRAQGLLTDGVQAYINKLFEVPPVVPTKVEADTAAAAAQLAALKAIEDSLTDKTIHLTTVQSTVDGSHAAGVGNTGDSVAYALGGTVRYLAGGGIGDPLARGTDTVRAMLTPDEEVINRASANQIRRDHPGALEYMNATGKLPATGGGAPVVVQSMPDTVTLVVDGQQFTAYVDKRADARVGAAFRDAAMRRPRI
jgi:hypothetical protein